MTRLNVLYNLSLPHDIIKYIYSFLSGSCDKCMSITVEYYLYNKCVIYKYYNIFDDRYFFPREMEEYKLLCYNCSNNYKKYFNKNKYDENDESYENYFIDYSSE